MNPNNIKNQHDFLRQYTNEYRKKFNNEIFQRSDDNIIIELEKVILSCQKSVNFTLRVDKFTIVDDYDKIRSLLKEQEKFKSRSRNKSRNKIDDKYNYIPLKDSDIRLLIVDYYLEVPFPKDEKYRSKNLRVLIEVPKIVDKYYFRIFGNMYSSIYQIVDGSTYNNSQSINAKSQCVAFKTMFMASRVYKYNFDVITTLGESISGIYFHARIFNKGIPIMKYILAKFGLYNTMVLFKVPNIVVSDNYINDDDYYTIKKNDIYISIPIYIYTNDNVAQSLMYTIYMSIDKYTTLPDLMTKEFWLTSLGQNFNNASEEKGKNILDSLESIYDLATRETLKLQDDHKQDIYDILIWITREFSKLKQKDNLDVSIKRIRYEEYFSAIYAIKQSKGLYRISDMGTKIQLSDIEKAIYTFPDYLLRKITKDQLVNYKNNVNDIDAIQALKYTYKGVSGIGENGQMIPASYKQMHPSYVGRLDTNSSTSNDPGLSGVLCPLAKIHNNVFTDYMEPDTWREKTDEMLSKYNELVGLQQVVELQKDAGLNVRERENALVESIETLEKLLTPVAKIENEIDELEWRNPNFIK